MDRKTHSRFFGMLGLAMRAGKIALGTDLIIASMKANGDKRAKLILVSEYASLGTRNRLSFKAEYYNTPIRVIDAAPELLGNILGKSYAPVALAILDAGFAEQILQAIEPSTDKTER